MIEVLDNVIALGSDPFTGQNCSRAGKVSYWAAVEGGDPMGNPVAAQVMQRGIPFGHGDRRVIRGITEAQVSYTVTDKDGKRHTKTKPNIIKGPSGREYVELEVDESDMIEKQKWEGSVSNDAVKSAQGSAAKNLDPNDKEISSRVTTMEDRIERISDDEIERLAEQRLQKLTNEAP